MFNRVLNDLKDCEYKLQMIADDKDTDIWVSLKLRPVISTIEDTQKNICAIADSYEKVPNVTKKGQKSAKFETAGELLEFLLGLSDRDLNKPVVIGRNEWDDRMYMRYVGVQYEVDWVSNGSNDVMICCK